MTRRAARTGSGKVSVTGRKIRLRAGVVAFCAKRLFLLREKTGVGSAMRQVARRTGFGGGRMECLPGEIARVMAAQAELPLGLIEHGRVVGAVGVMAIGALPNSGMFVACRQLRLLPRVAPETEIRLFGLQFQSADESVRLVAGGAVALSQRSVGHSNRTDDVRVTFDALVSLLEASAALQLGRRGIGASDPGEAGKAEDRREEDDREASLSALSHLCPRWPASDPVSASWSPDSWSAARTSS